MLQDVQAMDDATNSQKQGQRTEENGSSDHNVASPITKFTALIDYIQRQNIKWRTGLDYKQLKLLIESNNSF